MHNNLLTIRELDVLRLVAGGYSDADITRELVVSPHTVARHLQNICSKLGVHDRVEAANWAARNGLL